MSFKSGTADVVGEKMGRLALKTIKKIIDKGNILNKHQVMKNYVTCYNISLQSNNAFMETIFKHIKNSRLAEKIVNTMTVKQNKNKYTFKYLNSCYWSWNYQLLHH